MLLETAASMSLEAMGCARLIFEYHQLRHLRTPSDVLIVLGTNDTRVARFAAELYHQGLSKMLVVTGGIAHQDDLLATNWNRAEAEVFADVLAELNVPRKQLLLEPHARNTAENIAFSQRLLAVKALEPRSILYAVKPFMQRRVFATHAVQWPETPANVVSWKTTFDEYCTDELTPSKVTHIIMGDLQRIWIYAQRGYSAPQRIPPDVKDAFDQLVELGFTQHLISDG